MKRFYLNRISEDEWYCIEGGRFRKMLFLLPSITIDYSNGWSVWLDWLCWRLIIEHAKMPF